MVEVNVLKLIVEYWALTSLAGVGAYLVIRAVGHPKFLVIEAGKLVQEEPVAASARKDDTDANHPLPLAA